MRPSVSGRTVVTGAVAAAVAAGAGSKAPAASRQRLPNILWFVSEDNHPLLGADGERLARTPTIDRLASRGIFYRNAYCTSPVCEPSRFSILTGLYPETAGPSGEMGSSDAVLPNLVQGDRTSLRMAGYCCANNAKKNEVSHFDYVEVLDESSNKAHWRNRPAGKPFMAVFNTFATPESALFRPLAGKVTPAAVPIPPYRPDTPGVRRDVATFYNAMEKMDGELAACLAELEEVGVADDTIVFYYSDNGGIFPRGKRFCREPAPRCPLVPYIPAKRRTGALGHPNPGG